MFVLVSELHRACQRRWLRLGDAQVRPLRGSVRGRGGYALGARERLGLSGGYGRRFGHGGGDGAGERLSS